MDATTRFQNRKDFKQEELRTNMEQEKKQRFLEVYKNLPLVERKNTILLLEDKIKDKIEKKPISWDIAFLEIEQETKIGENFLDKLIKLNLI